MHKAGLSLTEVTQHEVDQWLTGGRSTRYEVRDFLVWSARRGHSRDLDVPHRPRPDPVALDEDSHWEILRQCLTDTALPLDVRAAGAVLFLFGHEVTRIAALPADAVTVRAGETVLVLDQIRPRADRRRGPSAEPADDAERQALPERDALVRLAEACPQTTVSYEQVP
jgi:hypothetical protein